MKKKLTDIVCGFIATTLLCALFKCTASDGASATPNYQTVMDSTGKTVYKGLDKVKAKGHCIDCGNDMASRIVMIDPMIEVGEVTKIDNDKIHIDEIDKPSNKYRYIDWPEEISEVSMDPDHKDTLVVYRSRFGDSLFIGFGGYKNK